MAYLHIPRLVFAGDFMTDVSTINNDPAHYNNQTFKACYQEYGVSGVKGWWNPEGGANFRFKDCSVTRMTLPDGTEMDGKEFTDIVVKSAEGRANGKIVDIDPQQQGCSQLWGLTLRILKGETVILKGNIYPTAYRDLQWRQYGNWQINGQPVGGTWTSVLEDVVWGEPALNHPFFRALKENTHGNRISIHLNAFGYYKVPGNSRFMLGRIIGTIGPWKENEPLTFAPCRRLYGVLDMGAFSDEEPPIYFGNTNFLVEKEYKRLTLDLGSSFPIADALGSITYQQKLFLAVSRQPLTNGIMTMRIKIPAVDFLENFALVAPLPFDQGDQWLNKTGGLVTVALSEEILDLLEGTKDSSANQLVLLAGDRDEELVLIARESIGGYYLRADEFVQRLDNGDKQEVQFFAYRWGHPIPAGRININLLPPTPVKPVGSNNPICEIPGNNYPTEGISYDPMVPILNGKGILHLQGNTIHNPRGYIDGQMYFLDYELQGIGSDPAMGPYSNDVISIHLRDAFDEPETPVWEDIKEIMTQFANLYPIMSKYLVNLKDPNQVFAKKDILLFAFSLDFRDPAYMPVTRDLSEAKRRTIIKWLRNQKPLFAADGAKPGRQQIPPLSNRPVASPVEPTQSLTEKQKKLQDAMRLKNGMIKQRHSIEILKF